MDVLTPDQRRRAMKSVKSAGTAPELIVRKLLFHAGFRFRLHSKNLPGKPDIVLPRYKTVIFVNGCFWHQHPGCNRATRPSSRLEYWQPKLDRNVERDSQQQLELEALGWKVVVVWECQTKSPSALRETLRQSIETIYPA